MKSEAGLGYAAGKIMALSALLFGLTLDTGLSQIEVPLTVANTFAGSSGGSTLLGVNLGPNTTVQGVITAELDAGFQDMQIQLTLSDGVNRVTEDNSGYNGTHTLTQDLVASTVTLSTPNLTPWGGLFQDVVYLPPAVMQSAGLNGFTAAQTTLLYVLGGKTTGPGVPSSAYRSVVTISDGTTTAVFNPTPIPEPGTLAWSALGGLASILFVRRKKA